MFKNVMVYRIDAGWKPHLATSEAALQAALFAPCSASQDKSVGWAPPRGHAHGACIESIGGQWLAQLVIETKSVPTTVLRSKLQEQVDHIESSTGRRPGKKEKRQMQDELRSALLPQAFARQSRVWVWIDPKQKRLMIDAGSQAKADEVLTALVRALEGFNPTPMQTQTSAQAAMSQWLLTRSLDDWPSDWAPDRECQLQSADEERSVIRYTRHAVSIDEVRAHIKDGKLPTRLGLQWQGVAALVLTEAGHLKKFHLLDTHTETGDTPARDAADDPLDADVALITGTLSPLIDSLVAALGGWA